MLPEKKSTEVAAQLPDIITKNSGIKKDDKKEKKQNVLYQKNNNAVVKNIISTQKPTEKNITNQLPEKLNDATVISNNEIKNISKNEISSISKIDPLKELAQNVTQNNPEKATPVTYAQTTSYVTNAIMTKLCIL